MRVFKERVAVGFGERGEALVGVEAHGVDSGAGGEEVDPAGLVVGDEAALVGYRARHVANLCTRGRKGVPRCQDLRRGTVDLERSVAGASPRERRRSRAGFKGAKDRRY